MQNLTTVTSDNFGDIERIEYQGQLVLTTAQLAQFYECSVDSIKVNYNRNVDRFIKGKHFFRLEGDALRAFKREVTDCNLAASQLNLLYLWTKRGAARHAKMLNTDRAWEVFELLEDNYFDRRADNQFVALERERLELDRDRLNFELEQFAVANSDETKAFAKAQLLRELASASGDNQSMRNDLIRHAAKVLIGEDFEI